MKYSTEQLKADAAIFLGLLLTCLTGMFLIGCRETIINTNVVKMIHNPTKEDELTEGMKIIIRDENNELYLLIVDKDATTICPAN